MTDALEAVGDFLAQNPEEVVVLVLQDYLTGKETEQVFREAGLLDRVWPLAVDRPMPRLRELVESGRTLVVTSENHGGEVPWMPDAYAVTEETPYLFSSVDAFTCTPNRGGTGKPLFLLNHWISGDRQRVAAARVANSRAVLDTRLQQCRQQRGRTPNIIAVDFADIGDAAVVVDRINRSGVLSRAP